MNLSPCWVLPLLPAVKLRGRSASADLSVTFAVALLAGCVASLEKPLPKFRNASVDPVLGIRQAEARGWWHRRRSNKHRWGNGNPSTGHFCVGVRGEVAELTSPGSALESLIGLADAPRWSDGGLELVLNSNWRARRRWGHVGSQVLF